MLLEFFNELKNINCNDKNNWGKYFDSFQSSEDGLFYDNNIINEYYNNSDWWGARHLTVHLISSYIDLGIRTKYKFYFSENYYGKNNIHNWLNSINWNEYFSHSNDIDNKIMNIACLMQYSRDYWNDKKSEDSIKYIMDFLISKINNETGMCGNFDLSNNEHISRMVQFFYHLYSIFEYDNIKLDNLNKIIDFTLKTQNFAGGYGVKLNSSACEDIDSIYILVKVSKYTDYRKNEIVLSLKRALASVLSNFNDDGGFVFRRNEPFTYDHIEMYSDINKSNLFATWFRTLSIIYILNFLEINNEFKLSKHPFVN